MKLNPRGKDPVGPSPATGAPGADRRGFALEHFLPYRLSVLTNTISGAIARLYARRFGLTIPEWRVMAVLDRFGPLSANQVCRRTAMDKVRVSRAVARLVARGLVARRADPHDRRRAVLRLAAQGRAVLRLAAQGRAIHHRIVPLARAREARLLAPLTPAERATLDRLLTKLQTRADELADEG